MSDYIYSRDEIAEVVTSLLKKYRAEKAILFGSYARQEASSGSDIDLLIVGGAEFEPTDVFAIADELYRRMGKNVDVYEIQEIDIDSAFYSTIMEEGVQIA